MKHCSFASAMVIVSTLAVAQTKTPAPSASQPQKQQVLQVRAQSPLAQSPFGFHAGMTRAEIIKVVGVGAITQTTEDIWVLHSVPRPYLNFDDFSLIVTASKGLVNIEATAKVHYGTSETVIRQFKDLERVLTGIYGRPSGHSQSWYDPDLGSMPPPIEIGTGWKLAAGSASKITRVGIMVSGSSADTSYLSLSYTFSGYDEWAKSVEAAENSNKAGTPAEPGEVMIQGWRRVKVYSDSQTILGGIDVNDSTWDRLQLRWKYPCASVASSLLLLVSGKGEGAKSFDGKRVEKLFPSGIYEYSLPKGTGSVTVLMSGTRCTADLELEIFAPFSHPKSDGDFDFRHTRWGMSKEEVTAAEGMLNRDTPDVLLYETDLVGSKVATAFEFADGKLARTRYSLMEKYTEPGEYLVTSAKWLDVLKEKYGEPKREVQGWDDYYRVGTAYATAAECLAISTGRLVFQYSWEPERSQILWTLGGKDSEIMLTVTYTSKQLEGELAEKAAGEKREAEAEAKKAKEDKKRAF